MHPPTTILVPPCPSIQLIDLLTNEEIAQARAGYIVLGVARTYSEFVRTHLQGCLAGISIPLFLSEVKFSSCIFFFIFLLGNNICMFDFQTPSFEKDGEGEEEEEEIPFPHHAGSFSNSFMET